MTIEDFRRFSAEVVSPIAYFALAKKACAILASGFATRLALERKLVQRGTNSLHVGGSVIELRHRSSQTAFAIGSKILVTHQRHPRVFQFEEAADVFAPVQRNSDGLHHLALNEGREIASDVIAVDEPGEHAALSAGQLRPIAGGQPPGSEEVKRGQRIAPIAHDVGAARVAFFREFMPVHNSRAADWQEREAWKWQLQVVGSKLAEPCRAALGIADDEHKGNGILKPGSQEPRDSMRYRA